MQYRTFGPLDMETSILGFGCMRLPTRDGQPQSQDIDRDLTRQLARHALENGINYFDTAYTYHSGQSEVVLGEIFSDLPRNEVYLVTKMPIWQVKERRDFDRLLDEQLTRLKADYVDGYLLHNLKLETYRKLCTLGVREWLEAQKAKGRIAFTGFSSHEIYQSYQEIIDDWSGWDACQIQYNYLNENTQAGSRGLAYAYEKDLAVVVMEPLLGGTLADPPPVVNDIFTQSPIRRTPAEWALRWLWNRSEISTVLSGMNSMSQLQENIAIANSTAIGSLSADESALIRKVHAAYCGLWPIPCTNCGYCQPCPSGVDIPRIFELYNHAIVHHQESLNQYIYHNIVPSESRADRCQECGQCEEHCPQSITIINSLARVHGMFTDQHTKN